VGVVGIRPLRYAGTKLRRVPWQEGGGNLERVKESKNLIKRDRGCLVGRLQLWLGNKLARPRNVEGDLVIGTLGKEKKCPA